MLYQQGRKNVEAEYSISVPIYIESIDKYLIKMQ